jgi:2'-hydroxyisoflavone reductase
MVRGDRDGGLTALPDRRWDAVIDTCGYLPRVVRQSAELLAPKVSSYCFISSISVYREFDVPGLDEDYPLAALPDPAVEMVDRQTYGGLKVLCERAVEAALPRRSLIVRPGIIVGPFDPTDRFTYWLHRVKRGGEVLAPADPAAGLQFVDVRDLAGWILSMVEDGQTGAYNATGPEQPVSFGHLLEECRRVSESDAVFTWVAESFLLREKVVPWRDMPLWLPGQRFNGFNSVRIDRALNRGLNFRPLAETLQDLLAWEGNLPEERTLAAGLTMAQEAQLLGRWKNPGPAGTGSAEESDRTS